MPDTLSNPLSIPSLRLNTSTPQSRCTAGLNLAIPPLPILKIITTLCFLLSFTAAFSQLNMTLQDSMGYATGVNDVCGWAAPDGKEYALVGLNTGVSIVDINADILREVAFVPGENNIWRDINTYSHYAYVSSEARTGLLIIDLQYLPDSVKTYIWQDSLPGPGDGKLQFQKAHTLWVDENGICYLNGSNLNGGGVVMVDVATDPLNPSFLGYAPPVYSHDCYTRDGFIYSAEIFSGTLSIYDAHDPSDVTLVSRFTTPNEFTHNAWLSDDSRYLFTTDERANSYVTAYDITHPGEPFEVDRYRHAPTEGANDVPHNVYVLNDWLVVAYYTNGTTIVDASRPDNLIEVGHYDSYLGPHGGYNGVWGSFPYLPSGKILSSDRDNGLFVFIPEYVRACFLEGTVIDSVTRLPVVNATITIESDEIILPELSGFNGGFKTGKAVPGTFAVRVSKEGYYDKVLELDFTNGQVLSPVVELVATDGTTSTNAPSAHTSRFTFYPNPLIDGDLYFQARHPNGDEIRQLTFMDIRGRVVSSRIVAPGSISLHLDDQCKGGIYFVRWITEYGETGVEKIVVIE